MQLSTRQSLAVPELKKLIAFPEESFPVTLIPSILTYSIPADIGFAAEI